MKIYKTKKEVLEELGANYRDYQAFKRLLDRGIIYEVWYGNRVGYVIFNEILVWVEGELVKKCWKSLQNEYVTNDLDTKLKANEV